MPDAEFGWATAKTWADRYLAWIFICLGLLLMLTPHLLAFMKISTLTQYRESIEKLGEIVLIGGVFDATIKSYQFTKIFADQLKVIMYAPSFAEKVREMGILDAWKDLAAGAYRNSLPAVACGLEASLPERIPLDKTCYYQKYSIRMFADWADRQDKSRVTVMANLAIDVVMAAEDSPFPYRTELSFLEPDAGEWKVVSLNIDDRDYVVDGRPVDDAGSLLRQVSSERSRLVYDLDPPLTGRLTHRVERVTEATLPLATDPFLSFEVLNYCTAVELRLYVMPSDLKVHFRQIGTSASFREFMPPREPGEAHMAMGRRYDSLLYPGQGYTLAFYGT